MSQLALDLIAQEAIQKTGYLELGNCGLTPDNPLLQQVWEELGKLTHLETLILSKSWEEKMFDLNFSNKKAENSNFLAEHPSTLQHLINLTTYTCGSVGLSLVDRWQITEIPIFAYPNKLLHLNLGSNNISQIQGLNNLLNLQTLSLSNNKIIKIENLDNLPDLQVLDLSYNILTKIENLGNLPNLETLNLSHNQLAKIENLDNLTSLLRLDLDFNRLTKIDNLDNLPNLLRLNLDFNRLTKIDNLDNLPNLLRLNLSSNQLTKIDNLNNLPNLRYLRLSSNPLTMIENLDKLPNLQMLNLSSNQLTKIDNLSNLPNLQMLNLSSNQLTKIENLDKLPNLQWLDVSSNQITKIENLDKLPNLQMLNLYSNQLTKIENFSNLPYLQTLSLTVNQLTKIENLDNLPDLLELDLSSNQLTNIENLDNLPNLETLNLEYNNITTPITLTFLQQFPKLEELGFRGNPVPNIQSELISDSNCFPALRTYLQDLGEGGEPNNEVKVLFIGNGNVGKTQIAGRLAWQEKFVFNTQHHSTHAICLLKRHLPTTLLPQGLQLNLWDLGGQDVYHATHRLFMRTRALFLLVWDKENEAALFHTYQNRQYDNEKLLYWLSFAQYFGIGSPVLVVQNKIDATSHLHDPYPYPRVQNELKTKFPAIVDFIGVSTKTGKGFIVLADAIERLFTENPTLRNDLLNKPLPKTWLQVRHRIRQEQENEKGLDLIPFSLFEQWCHDAGIAASAPTLAHFLHQTGVVYYQPPYFSGQIILNQAWAIEAVYQVLDREGDYFEILEYRQGTLDYTTLCRIWAKNTNDERNLFIDFMLSSELCFETTPNKKYHTPLQERTFTVPQALPPTEPPSIATEQTRLQANETITRSYTFLPSIFIQRFMIRAHRFSEHRYMWQHGIGLYNTDEAYAVVRANYTHGQHTITIHYNAAAVASKLLQAIEEEVQILEAEDKDQSKPFKEKSGFKALNYYQKPKTESVMSQNKLNLFISYSPEDETFKKAFDKHLTSLRRSEQIATWDSSNVLAGSNLSSAIEGLQNAHVILILVSTNYISDDKLWKQHLLNAIYRHERGFARIIPIKITDFDDKNLPFSKIQGLPRNGKAIGSPNNNAAWLEVAKEIRAVVEDMLAKGIGVQNNIPPQYKQEGQGNNKPKDNPYPQSKEKKKVLFICSSPSNVDVTLNFGTEFRNIADALNSSSHRQKFNISIKTGVQFDELTRLLLQEKSDVLHISMHSSLEKGGLLFEYKDSSLQPLNPESLTGMIRIANYQLDLVVLSACNSKAHAVAVASLTTVANVIGMNDLISDEAAAYYAEKFYEIYFDHQNVLQAHQNAQESLKANSRIGDHTIFAEVPYIQKLNNHILP